MDFNKMAAELGVDAGMFVELVDAWLNSTGEDIEKLETVRDASEIKTAVEHAHKIKGASFQLGFNDIAETAREIELKARAGSLEGLAASVARLKSLRDEIAETRKNFKR